MGFLLANWRFVLGVLSAAGLTALVMTCQQRGDHIVVLNKTIAGLNTLINLKDDTIATDQAVIGHLKIDTARLNRRVGELTIAGLEKDAQISAGALAASRTDAAIEAGKRTVNRLVNQMTAQQMKQTAESGLARENLSYYGAGLDVADTATTSRFAKLTEYGQVYHDSTQELKKQNGQLTEENGQLKKKNVVLTDEKSDLEKLLNGYRNADADAIDAVVEKKRFLTIGLKKDVKAVSTNIRRGQVQPKSK